MRCDMKMRLAALALACIMISTGGLSYAQNEDIPQVLADLLVSAAMIRGIERLDAFDAVPQDLMEAVFGLYALKNDESREEILLSESECGSLYEMFFEKAGFVMPKESDCECVQVTDEGLKLHLDSLREMPLYGLQVLDLQRENGDLILKGRVWSAWRSFSQSFESVPASEKTWDRDITLTLREDKDTPFGARLVAFQMGPMYTDEELAAIGSTAHRINIIEGTDYYPDEEHATYIFHYRIPMLETYGTDAVAMMVNDTLQTGLDEMRDLVLPMFASSEDMTRDGVTEMYMDHKITCDNGALFSLLITREEHQGGQLFCSVDAQTFDISGEYAGETLTLRGVVRVGESSDQIADAVRPVLYEYYLELAGQGVCPGDITQEDFNEMCAPTLDFYADENGNAVFFFPPYMLTGPTLDVPGFTFTPAQLAALCEGVPVNEQ